MKYLRLKEWAKYQHYRNRNPPWIKLHQEILGSYTWVTLDDASRLLALTCMLLAARTGNKIPLDRDYIQRAAYLKARPDVRPLVDCGFAEIVDDGPESTEHTPLIQEKPKDEQSMLADASTMLATSEKCYPRGRERVRDREEKEKSFVPPTLEQVADYCRQRNKGVDPEKWFAYYEANGWHVGRHKMKSWKSAITYWETNGFGGKFNDGYQKTGRNGREQLGTQARRAANNIDAVLGAFPELAANRPANGPGQAARSGRANPPLLEGETEEIP